jgi:hypothetical protein
VSFRLRFSAPQRAIESMDLYGVAEAGATARIELDGYALDLDGTGVVELARGCESLLAILQGGAPAPADEELRAELPGAPAGAAFHQWLFSSFMYRMPVLIFAITPQTTWIATRTHEETEGWPLIALEGRDLAEPVVVPTAEVEAQARGYLAATVG